jgi:small subunit ribosomal protein S16
MSVKIRLNRVGAKTHPIFRIVVAASRSPRDGKFIEELGTYHPHKKSDKFTLDLERAQYWISRGALPSATTASFIKKAVKDATAPKATPSAPAVEEATPAPREPAPVEQPAAS